MPQKLILIAGYPAAGKTTFSRALSRHLNIPCFNKDSLNEIIGTRMAIPDVPERRRLSETSFHLLLHIADRLLETGCPLVLESNFKPEQAPAVQALIDRHGCETLTFLLAGELDTIYKRFADRERSDDRHPIHKSHGLADRDAFIAAVKPLEGFAVSGGRVVVDTTDFGAMNQQELFAQAHRFLAP